jgi:hypothetical protein
MERRKSPRIKCRFPCELSGSRLHGPGTVLDMSEGGLSVLTALEIDQGESLTVRFQAPGIGAVAVEAMVWHSRRVRDRATGDNSCALGLMVSRASEAYSRLVAPSGASPAESADASVLNDADEVCGDALGSYRIRVKERASPRTRILTLSATSDEEARALAITHLGEEWEVLEVGAA